jgi:hypothetical protein
MSAQECCSQSFCERFVTSGLLLTANEIHGLVEEPDKHLPDPGRLPAFDAIAPDQSVDDGIIRDHKS